MTKRKRLRRRSGDDSSILKPHEIGAMRAAGRFAAELLDVVESRISPGVSTAEIDALVDQLTRDRGGRSAPLGYRGYPAHCCISINEVVCHGIPSADRVLASGDIVNVDVTPIIDGFHGDASRTFLVGDVNPIAQRLVEDTYSSLWLGICAVGPGGRIGDIGHAIQSFVEPRGYSVVRQFSGHGTGRTFHTAPAVMHYGRRGQGEAIRPGMTFTIEPMINLGDWRCDILEDGWTAVTVDRALSAQFEHTVMVTEHGVEVLTAGAAELERIAAVGLNIPGHVRIGGLAGTGPASVASSAAG
jgi:methionyl aminopeptidase